MDKTPPNPGHKHQRDETTALNNLTPFTGEIAAFRVGGHSMTGPGEESFPIGTLVLVDDSVRPEDLQDGDFVVLVEPKYGEQWFCLGKLERGKLAFLDPNFAPMKIREEHGFVGRVIEALSTLYVRLDSTGLHVHHGKPTN